MYQPKCLSVVFVFCSLMGLSLVVQALPDMEAVKTNGAGGGVPLGGTWNWTIHVSNVSTTDDAVYNANSLVLIDDLPDDLNISYGAPAYTALEGIPKGEKKLTCKINAAKTLSCTTHKNFGLTISNSTPTTKLRAFTVEVPVTSTLGFSGAADNPRTLNRCAVNEAIAGDENSADNYCSDTVTVADAEVKAISLAKTVMIVGGSCGTDDQDLLDISAPGDVTYCYEVTNTGNVSIAGLTVDDDLLGPINGCSATLAVAASTTCTINKTVTQAEIDADTAIVNTGTASATDVADATDTAALDFIQNPAISLDKTAMAAGGSCGTDDQDSMDISAPGDVSYCYQVTNTGNVSVSGLAVGDDLLGRISGCSVTLAVAASTTCSINKTVTQAEIDAGTAIVNTGTASAIGAADALDTATLNFIRSPAISLDKTVMAAGGVCGADDQDPMDISAPGDVSYCYRVTNTGNVSITGLTLSDDLLGSVTGCSATLAVASSTRCSINKTVTQAEIDAGTAIVNTGTASATNVDSAIDTAALTFIQSPAIDMAKAAVPATYMLLGDPIEYTYIITNTGNVTLDPGLASVTDDKVTVSCPDPVLVAPQGEVTCSAMYSITQQDLDDGSVTNKATADIDGVMSAEQTATVSRLSEACYDGALIIPDGQIFSGAGTTWLSSAVSIETEMSATAGVMVEPPHTLVLKAPTVEFNPLFEVLQNDIPEGAQLQVIVEPVVCP